MKISKIILASHGTPGARAAEEAAIELAAENNAALFHLFIVPDFWKSMMGDDWLNNAVSQIRFGSYVENQLANEAADEVRRLHEAAKANGVDCISDVRVGKPAEQLIDACTADTYDLAVIGAPRPKGMSGYRSRMALEPLVRGLNARLLIVPHPPRTQP